MVPAHLRQLAPSEHAFLRPPGGGLLSVVAVARNRGRDRRLGDRARLPGERGRGHLRRDWLGPERRGDRDPRSAADPLPSLSPQGMLTGITGSAMYER